MEILAETDPRTPDLTLVTLTGDRPEAFRLCERYMARQTFPGLVEWLVVCDGVEPTLCTLGQRLVRRARRKDDPAHTLIPNLLAADKAGPRAEKMLFIEDDDWFAPGYVERMSAELADCPLVGLVPAPYYHVRMPGWMIIPNLRHASLVQTGVRREAWRHLLDICRRQSEPWVDMKLWSTWPKPRPRRLIRLDKAGEPYLVVGLKGLPGRKGLGRGHRADYAGYAPDPNGDKLAQWIGTEDAGRYAAFGPAMSRSVAAAGGTVAHIFCPGPSLVGCPQPRAHPHRAGEIRIAVNRAASAFECDWWSALDIGTLEEVRTIGRPSVLTNRASWRRFLAAHAEARERRHKVPADLNTAGLAAGTKWANLSALSAIVLARHLGARTIHLWGADMKGRADWDGRTEARWRRGDGRWQDEASRLKALCEDLRRQGVTVSRHLANGSIETTPTPQGPPRWPPRRGERVRCPHCGGLIVTQRPKCPHCKRVLMAGFRTPAAACV